MRLLLASVLALLVGSHAFIHFSVVRAFDLRHPRVRLASAFAFGSLAASDFSAELIDSRAAP